jgi:glycosyltransferase involved in cell wall biosynthesis
MFNVTQPKQTSAAAPRILIAGNFLSAHGYARGVCEELALRLRELGWSVITTSRQPFRPVRLVDMMSTVWLHRHDYDVAQVDVYSGPAFFWAEAVCWLLRRAARPYVLTLHGGRLPEFAKRERDRVCKLLNSAALVTVPSPYLLNQMAEYRRDLILLPNALDLENYRHSPRPELRPRLIWLRALHDIYNPLMAVRVLALLKKDYPSITLTMVGPDKEFGVDKLFAEAKQYGVESQLTVTGKVPKKLVPEMLSSADIFLNTSNVDNTPVSVLEAMAAGLCVVSTAVGGIPYLLKSEDDALLVPVNDHYAMATAVRSLLTDRKLAKRIQAASQAKVRGFDWSLVLPQWQDLLTSLAEAKPDRHLFVQGSVPIE